MPSVVSQSTFSYILVGGGTASFAAEEAIREKDPKADILVVSEEGLVPYQRPPLSKELWMEGSNTATLTFKDWLGAERDVFYKPPSTYYQASSASDLAGPLPEGKHGKLLVAKVVGLDVAKKTLVLDSGEVIRFEKGVLLAMGGRPRDLDVAVPKDTVSTYRTVGDFRRLHETAKNGTSVFIVGNGLLGTELAVALANRGVAVTQAFKEDFHLPLILPRYLSQWTTSRVQAQGVHVLTSTEIVSAIEAPDSRVVINTSDGRTHVADHVVVSLGIVPNSEVAQGAGLQVDPEKGGIAVNSFLEAAPNVYAAGDVISFQDTALSQRRQVEHHDHAVMSGRIAGSNLVGPKKHMYTHQPFFWFELGHEAALTQINCEAVGILDAALPTVGVWAKGDGTDKRYTKGVVFYLRDRQIVGILTWNTFGKIGTARRILEQRRMVNDITEIAGYFDVHDEE
ncbi:Apoptosis-inducing factor 1, mitochondrial [Gonapodya sp. JEL0774]|nr:Apoptosis-inducing factor 1, mitochondrial [Gonapodya sp. JEL0774]